MFYCADLADRVELKSESDQNDKTEWDCGVRSRMTRKTQTERGGMIAPYSDSEQQRPRRTGERQRCGQPGFTVPELLIVLIVGAVLTAIALPMYNSAMLNMRMNSMVGAISGAVSRTRYQSIMSSKIYTLAITAPGNSYVVTDVTDGTAASAVPLPSTSIAVNGGTAATYTFTLCPNGVVYGAGGVCATGSPAPPALALTCQSREIDITVSGVGNVTSNVIH